jgi:thymidine kinase
MGKLYFRYGTMGSAKTANALMTYYNFKHENKKNVLLMKPAIDNRDGITSIKSRIGLLAEAIIIDKRTAIRDLIREHSDTLPDWIIIDEAQFLTAGEVDQLVTLADLCKINILTYGLRADFKGDLFEGSKRLFEMADKIEEIKSQCHCGKKAIMNARVVNNEVVYSGEQIQLGSNESYVMLCRKCWLNGSLS